VVGPKRHHRRPRGGGTTWRALDDPGFLDEPATARALAGFVLRGVDCGAVDSAEVDKLIGVDVQQLAQLAGRAPRG
jgi:hypothetical protein